MSTVLKIADVVTADDHLPARARSSVKLPAKDDTLWKLVIGPFEDFYNHLVKNAMFLAGAPRGLLLRISLRLGKVERCLVATGREGEENDDEANGAAHGDADG